MAGIDSYTKLILHCNGIDESTTFIDESDSSHTVTAQGNAQIDTAQKKFGTASGLFDGNDHLSIPDSDDWDFGSGEFTIDFWIRPTQSTAWADVVGQWMHDAGDLSFLIAYNTDNKMAFAYSTTGSNQTILYATTAMTLNVWQHIAIVRNNINNTIKIYLDGTEVKSIDITGVTINNSSRVLAIGSRASNSYGVKGHLDEVRISKGIARWTSNFTPPTTEYDIEIHEFEDGLSLSDEIETKLSREQIKPEDSLLLTDEIEIITRPQKVYLEDTLNLSDSIIKGNLYRKEEGLNIEDSINIDIQYHKNLEDALSLNDTIEAYAIDTEDITNKIRTRKLVLEDIDNKINTAIGVISDCTNLVSLVNGEIGDMDNDIRTLAESTNNVQNDIRILADYQIPGDAGFQSLGKEYIKVYIDGSEQTDLDVDSVTITKIISGIHTASFELGRAYDSTKPDMESVVLIKYHNWLLYKGYISSITPASTPESIRINCSDKYWKRNREKVYFFVGHKPTDDKEKYYYYISTALSTAIGWNPGIGNFVPQTITLFGTSESDAITNLITESGNFGWYYDENEDKKLWEAGRGSIVNLERQEIGKNLGLYQVLRHSFTENVLNIVNKLRVHMGDKVIRRFNATGGTKEYPGYTYESIHTAVNPDWNDNYEVLAKNSDNGYGWDWHKSSDNDKYEDVFIKYDLPFLNPESGSWTDRYPPQVEIIIPYSLWWECSVEEGILTEGFTIDYENQKLTFNKPIYLFRNNDYGEADEIRAPMVSLRLWKKRFYSNTEDESDDPESDVSYPLMFFTDKVGTYPETIMELLELTNLSIQYGGRYTDIDGNTVVVPSWNDTNFARDYAYWQLSNTAYKQTTGSVEITLDTAVTYGINLSNRIQIDGVTENALNINSMTYNISNFTVAVQLQNGQYYKRSVSLPSHGE